MATITGTVEGVSRKFGKFSILVNDVWYGTKQEWAPDPAPNKGDEVEFFTQDGKKYLNNCVILKPAAGGAPEAGSSAPKSKFVDNTIGMGVGAAMNQACQLLSSHDGKVPSLDNVEKLAIELFGIAESLKERASAGDITGVKESAKEELDNLMHKKFADE